MIKTRYGQLAVPNEQDIISRFLIQCGEWAWDEVGFVASVLPEGARVLDIGAFLGTFGLGLSLRKRLSFLCLVEANPTIFQLLETNIQSNMVVPAAVINALVTGLPSIPRAGWGDPYNLGSTSFTGTKANGNRAEPPKRAMTLADLRAEHGDFDLIKLDVEGMEREILSGDREYLAGGGTTLWVECNECPQSLELAEMLLAWGLDIYYFAFSSHNPDNFRDEDCPIFPWAYEAGLLVAPKNPPLLDAELTAHRSILHPIQTVENLAEAMWRTPRWLPPELAHADTTELAAIAGRALRGQTRGAFLVAETGAAGSAAKGAVSDRLADAEAGLSRAEALAFERQDQLQLERERREAAEAGLSRAEALAFERQDQLQLEHERREAAEAALATTTALALTRLRKLGAERERADLATAQIEAAEAQARAEAEARVCKAVAEADAQVRTMAAEADARVRTAVAEAELQLHALRQELVSVQTTVVWRLADPINTFVGARPRLHATLRRLRRLAGTLRCWVGEAEWPPRKSK